MAIRIVPYAAKHVSAVKDFNRHVIRAHPVLFALGMGGYDRPLPKCGWRAGGRLAGLPSISG
jgi:hypothetical protein